jgi:hypothetical protein
MRRDLISEFALAVMAISRKTNLKFYPDFRFNGSQNLFHNIIEIQNIIFVKINKKLISDIV